MIYGFLQALGRKKGDGGDGDDKTKLARVLSLLDLTGLGVGSTLGLGVYVLAGAVAKEQAGPAVVLSFLVAAVASAFAGVCYAEFAARVPKAGSAYVYSYVSVGEFVAFIIGWNLILEYVIGTAGVARGMSNYIDALSNYSMRTALTDTLPIDASYLSAYPDFLSFILVMVLAGVLAFGVKESTMLNNVFTGLNLVVIAVVIVAGATQASVDNWYIPKENVTSIPGAGEGGFLPYGFGGVMAGAAKCFFGFVGFDCIATTGEEAKNPQKNIPLAIFLSLLIIFFSYFGISTVLTMMIPYYLQDANAPFPHAFELVDMITIKWIVTIGAIFALCTSLLGAMFPLPRVLYAMGNDGIIFRFLSTINDRTQTPIIATVVSGIFAGTMAMLFDVDQLIDMMSIGTLLAYTIVAVCVLILRYEEPPETKIPIETIDYGGHGLHDLARKWMRKAFNLNMIKVPTDETSIFTKWVVGIFSLMGIGWCAVIVYGGSDIVDGKGWAVTVFTIVTIILVCLVVMIGRQPNSTLQLSFRVPFVPVLPAVSVLMNLYLMLQLNSETWIRFGVWLLIGFLIYFFYGIRNSTEKQRRAMSNKEMVATPKTDSKAVP